MRRKPGVYMIKNLITSKVYVGSSGNVKQRWKTHRTDLRGKRHHCHRLQEAWNTYGEDAFVFGVLEWCEVEDLTDLEQSWLDETQCYDEKFGYNLASDAYSPMLGRTHTEETKALISESSKERWQNQAHPMLGKPRSEECIRKLKATKARQKRENPEYNSHRKGAKVSEATRAKLSAAMKRRLEEESHPFQGKKHTEESKRKMSESLRGREAWNKGIPLTEETKRKLSSSLKGREISAHCRQRVSETHRGEGNSQAKLTEDDVLAILTEYSKGCTSQAKLGKKYGVSQAQIFHIVKGKSWKHVYTTFMTRTDS